MNNEGKFILIDKPAGWTSFDAVNIIRKQEREKTGIKNIRVGHAGTLDPFATGLLIIGIGREATKRLDEFKNLSKTYIATIRLGATTDTDDPTGTLSVSNVALSTREQITKKEIEKILKKFLGPQNQIPPMYSAKKIHGQRLYNLARAGKTIERQPQKIIIYNIRLMEYSWPDLTIEVECSTGTYIRTLAHDIGDELSVGGYCLSLRRTKIGEYKVENSRQTAIFDKPAKI